MVIEFFIRSILAKLSKVIIVMPNLEHDYNYLLKFLSVVMQKLYTFCKLAIIKLD